MPTGNKILTSASLCILIMITGLPAAQGGGQHPVFDDTFTTHIAHESGKGLNIRTDNGAITVNRQDRVDVEITAHVRCSSPERLEAACERALFINAYSYKSVQSILKKGLDQQPFLFEQIEDTQPLNHHNTRGKHYYH